MNDHNSTGKWDAFAFYVVLACCVGLVIYGISHRHSARVSPSDAATVRPAQRAP